ncbi:MAG: N-acetylglucosamine-6-phosphate deacetylase [Chloroflexota bacterium]
MSPSILITNAKVITPTAVHERGWLFAEGKQIHLIGSGNAPDISAQTTIDARGLNLIPGFIDVHVHGAVGEETMDSKPDGLRAMAQFYAQHGVTGFFPTTWTDTNERILASLEMVAEMMGQQPNGATILGVHLEGPYISVEKRGAQREQDVRRAGRTEALSYLDVNVIRLLALAPEYKENHWLISECVRRGITVSVAHTTANYEQIVEAVGLGLSHSTHTYNAMTGLSHREPGTLGAVMTLHDVYCELIADNIHVHPAAMQILFAAKGADRVVLITDAVRGAGLPEGEMKIDDRTVIIKDGAVRLLDGTLAGSTLTMDVGLRNFMAATGQPLEKIWQTSSLNAARSLQMSDHKGSLEVGKDADLVLVDDHINVHLTVAEGQVVYQTVG